MKHYAATIQCKGCEHRFSVCVHSPRFVASAEGFTVACPENGSMIHVPAGTLVSVESCPAGAVVVRDDRWWFVRWWDDIRRGHVR